MVRCPLLVIFEKKNYISGSSRLGQKALSVLARASAAHEFMLAGSLGLISVPPFTELCPIDWVM